MSSYYGVHLDDPATYAALDTAAKPSYGGAARSGETRFHFHPTYGWQKYRYALNDSGGALTAGLGYIWGVTTTSGFPMVTVNGVSVEASTIDAIIGIAASAIPDDYFGWFQVGGRGLIMSSAAASAGAKVDTDAAGKFDDDGTGALIGYWIGTASGADALTEAFINIPC